MNPLVFAEFVIELDLQVILPWISNFRQRLPSIFSSEMVVPVFLIQLLLEKTSHLDLASLFLRLAKVLMD